MNHLNYRELKKENQADCTLFEEMMWPYTKELDQHAKREMPREVIEKWVASIIRMCVRYLCSIQLREPY